MITFVQQIIESADKQSHADLEDQLEFDRLDSV